MLTFQTPSGEDWSVASHYQVDSRTSFYYNANHGVWWFEGVSCLWRVKLPYSVAPRQPNMVDYYHALTNVTSVQTFANNISHCMAAFAPVGRLWFDLDKNLSILATSRSFSARCLKTEPLEPNRTSGWSGSRLVPVWLNIWFRLTLIPRHSRSLYLTFIAVRTTDVTRYDGVKPKRSYLTLSLAWCVTIRRSVTRDRFNYGAVGIVHVIVGVWSWPRNRNPMST